MCQAKASITCGPDTDRFAVLTKLENAARRCGWEVTSSQANPEPAIEFIAGPRFGHVEQYGQNVRVQIEAEPGQLQIAGRLKDAVGLSRHEPPAIAILAA